MTVFLNNQQLTLPKAGMTVAELLEWQEINTKGSAVAIEDTLLRKDAWKDTILTDNMHLTVITAAFGG